MADRPVHEYIKELSDALVQLSDKVLDNIFNAMQAIKLQDEHRARQIIVVDDEIDFFEVRLEEQCLSYLALHQPVARDLRSIVTIMKINDDLERIGDLAVHIIERMPDIKLGIMEKYNFENMAHHAADMVRKAIQSFVTRNRHLADEVREMDEDVDAMHRLVFKRVAEGMKQPGADTDQLIAVLSISRYIERMADHATRIALEVIYLVTGEIERHTDGSFEKIIQSLSD